MFSEVKLTINTLLDMLEIYNNNEDEETITATLEKGVSNAKGQLVAALVELSPIEKAIRKGRKVGRQKYGDVHIGRKRDWFAKTIELKSITYFAPTNVDAQIKKGLMQLQGKYKKSPRPGDIWVLDISISNPLNGWPFGTQDQARKSYSLEKLWKKAGDRLVNLIEEKIDDALVNYINSRWDKAREELLQDVSDTSAYIIEPTTVRRYVEHRRSTRPQLVLRDKLNPDEVIKDSYLHALTIKIRYTNGNLYPITPPVDNKNGVEELKFQIRSENEPITKTRFTLRYMGSTLGILK